MRRKWDESESGSGAGNGDCPLSCRLRAKESGRKENLPPPAPPIRESKGKEKAQSFLEKLLAPRARVCTHKSERYRLARGVALEIIETCFGTADGDLRLWASIVYDCPEDAENILEKARTVAAEWRQGARRFPVQHFQKWLRKKFPEKSCRSFGEMKRTL